jgi:hypothetical protein
MPSSGVSSAMATTEGSVPNLLRPTAPQRRWLAVLSENPLGLARDGEVSLATMRACERRGWCEFREGRYPAEHSGKQWFLTEAGREVLVRTKPR